MGVGSLLVLAALVAAEPGDPQAPEALADPSLAVEWILSEEAPPVAAPVGGRWDGSLGGATMRGLFGFYRTVLSTQDSQLCAFTPSCSRFSQLAIARLGFARGVLVTADRLLRDHVLAVDFYDGDPETGLLRDDPDAYGPGAVP